MQNIFSNKNFDISEGRTHAILKIPFETKRYLGSIGKCWSKSTFNFWNFKHHANKRHYSEK